MDGTLAVIWLIISLTEIYVSDCPTACLGQSEAQSRFYLQGSQVLFQEDDIGREIYAGFDADRRFGPFQPTYGASVTSEGDFWIGAGAKWTSERVLSGPFFFEASLMPGLFARDGGPNIGGALQFRSALGAGFNFNNGGTVTILFDHRSNADTRSLNPGLETFGIRYAIPF